MVTLFRVFGEERENVRHPGRHDAAVSSAGRFDVLMRHVPLFQRVLSYIVIPTPPGLGPGFELR